MMLNKLGVVVLEPFPLVSKGDILVQTKEDEFMFKSTYEVYRLLHEDVLKEHPDCFELYEE